MTGQRELIFPPAIVGLSVLLHATDDRILPSPLARSFARSRAATTRAGRIHEMTFHRCGLSMEGKKLGCCRLDASCPLFCPLTPFVRPRTHVQDDEIHFLQARLASLACLSVRPSVRKLPSQQHEPKTGGDLCGWVLPPNRCQRNFSGLELAR